MSMKKLMTIVVATISMATFAKGIYFVSGGDFRDCHIKYHVTSETPNETLEITPTQLRVLGVYSNRQQFNFPWSVKCNGEETTFLGTDCIGQAASGVGLPGAEVNGASVEGGATNVFPLTMTLPEPATRLVKIYDSAYNIYNLQFKANPAITSIYVDWRDSPVAPLTSMMLNIAYMSNLVNVVWGNPSGLTTTIQGYQFIRLLKLDNFQILNPQQFTAIGQGAMNELNMTNDLVFVNVTNIQKQACRNNPNIHYVSIPNIQFMGEQSFNNGAIGLGTTQSNNLGLHRLRIGDKLNSMGTNCFYGHENLKTIEFVTSQEDWIAAWNNHAILPLLFGTVTASETTGEADFQPDSEKATPPSSLTTSTRWPKYVRKLILIRP